MAATAEVKSLTRMQKIAVLLTSLDEEVAATIMQQLEPNLMTQVADMIASLGMISGEDKKKAIADCAKEIVQMGGAVEGGENTAKALLKRAIGEKRAASLLESNKPAGEAPFAGLVRVPGTKLAEVLSEQMPSTIALVVRYLPVATAAKVLEKLPDDLTQKTIVAMAKSQLPADDVISQVDSFIKEQLRKKHGESVKAKDPTDTIAGILQHSDKALKEKALTAIESISEDTANKLRDKLFTFEDIVTLSNEAMRRVLSEIGTTKLPIALRNASIELREKFFNNMSKRATSAVREEMEISPKMKLSEVEAEQRNIIVTIRQLEAAGEIVIRGGEEDQYV
jgi:flagellar motor switch protein FliG